MTIPVPFNTVYAKSDTALAHPISAWFPRSRLSFGRAKMEVRDIVSTAAGTINVAIGLQFTNCEGDNPVDESTTLLHGFVNSAAVHYPPAMVDFRSVNSDKYLCRIVIYAKLSTGTDLTFARVGGMVELEECA